MDKEADQNGIEVTESVPTDERAIYEVIRETRLTNYPNEEYGVTKEDVAAKLLAKGSEKYERIMKRREETSGVDPNIHTWVAKENGRVVGMCFAVKHPDSNELRSIYVLPEYQGKGVGKALMDKAFDWIDKDKPLKLGVVVYNQPAIEFYKKLGFKETGNAWSNETPSEGREIPTIEMVKTF